MSHPTSFMYSQGIESAVLSVFSMLIGNVDVDEFREHGIAAISMLLVFCFLILLVLFNCKWQACVIPLDNCPPTLLTPPRCAVLIAIMSDSYDRVRENQEVECLKLRAATLDEVRA